MDISLLSKGPRVSENTPKVRVKPKIKNKESVHKHKEEDFEFPEPDLEMWDALKKGELLTEILTDFYDKVYEDDILKPYFKKVTKQRAIEKQYNFMFQLLTGENVYLGDKPRNAHHWMVVSNDIFDHRERLIEDSMLKLGLERKYIDKWLAFNESLREKIVKSEPWDKIQDGIVIPVDGYKEIELDFPFVCDCCHNEISTGTKVRYHVMEAKIYCGNCSQVLQTVND
jgi:truncated hemoglobin YjbI